MSESAASTHRSLREFVREWVRETFQTPSKEEIQRWWDEGVPVEIRPVMPFEQVERTELHRAFHPVAPPFIAVVPRFGSSGRTDGMNVVLAVFARPVSFQRARTERGRRRLLLADHGEVVIVQQRLNRHRLT